MTRPAFKSARQCVQLLQLVHSKAKGHAELTMSFSESWRDNTLTAPRQTYAPPANIQLASVVELLGDDDHAYNLNSRSSHVQHQRDLSQQSADSEGKRTTFSQLRTTAVCAELAVGENTSVQYFTAIKRG